MHVVYAAHTSPRPGLAGTTPTLIPRHLIIHQNQSCTPTPSVSSTLPILQHSYTNTRYTYSLVHYPLKHSFRRRMGDQVPELPLEVLSVIASLIPPPYYPGPTEPRLRPQPPSHVVEALDPRTPPLTHPTKILSFFSRSSHQLLEASRPWLWEDVDVRSGRGWLSVVNALTEEVMHEEEDAVETSKVEPKGLGMDIDMKPTSILKDGMPPTPISPVRHLEDLPEDGPVQLDSSIDGPSESQLDAQGMDVDNAPGPSKGLPPRSLSYSYSPPQQDHPSMLLTPPGSRTASPSPISAPKPLPQRPSALKSPVTTATAKLRGRSRSPRRSINFDTEGISAVLDRSRSVSAHPPKRIPLERRRSSLSRARTMAEMEDDEDEEMDDELMPLAKRSVSFTGEREVSPPVQEEVWENVNPELLPPPGPYIRHISFTNFKTIGSRRTQEEAVRGRFVTAGRLEGVIKVSQRFILVLTLELPESGHVVYDRICGFVALFASL